MVTGTAPLETVTVTATTSISSSRPLVRAPRGIVQLSGQTVTGWESWEVSTNRHYEADTFRVSFAVQALPTANNAAWFATQKQIFAEIFAGVPEDPANPQLSELDSLIYGRVDDITFDPLTGKIELTGRDLTAVFIDSKIAATYQDKKASDIATLLAQSHGLTPVVTATSENVGVYYKHDQVRLQATRSEWDLLAWLAREEGFVCFVKGHELHFAPPLTDSANPFEINWQPPTDSLASPVANVQEMTFSRALTISKGISVTARSASLTKKTPVVQSYPSPTKAIQVGKATPFGDVQNYFFTMAAGKKPVEVEAYAKQRYDAIVSHEMKMAARMPADNLLTPEIPVRVTGTGTAFDQTYFPRVVTRAMSLDEGYTMTIEAQNVSPDVQPGS